MAYFASNTRLNPAVIDLGSNTVILLVLDRGGRTVLDEARITRLGQGVFQTGTLDPAAAERTRDAVRELAAAARAAGAEHLIGVGTAALRRARDGESFLAALRREGLLDEARLLAEEQEAVFALEAHRHSGERLLVVDVGGGSTELAWSDPDGMICGRSLPIGSVQLTEKLVRSDPVSPEELRELRAAVEELQPELEEERTRGLGTTERIVAVAGTATTLAAMELRLDPYDPERVEGLRISRAVLGAWLIRLAGMTLQQRRQVPGLEPGRVDIIVAGLAILEGILTWLGEQELQISGRGVRYGVALRLLAGGSVV